MPDSNSSSNNLKSDVIYWSWMSIIVIGGLIVIGFMVNKMTFLVDIATTLSFLTAPLLAFINYRVVTGSTMPDQAKPGKILRILSWIGIIFLGGFSIFFLMWKFGSSILI
jgi:Mn2+/Fe2+ NRAMP family transporter